jgi:hypothetical protein
MYTSLRYYLAAKKEGGPKAPDLELHYLPRPEMTIEVRGMGIKTDTDTMSLLSAVARDYFPDDTSALPSMRLVLTDTDVQLLDKVRH